MTPAERAAAAAYYAASAAAWRRLAAFPLAPLADRVAAEVAAVAADRAARAMVEQAKPQTKGGGS